MATQGDLYQRIQDYAEYVETSFVAEIPNFVKAAEERIFYLCQIPFFKRNSTAPGTALGRYLQTPSDFRAPLSLGFTGPGGFVFLEFRDVNFMREVYPDDAVTGPPRFYALFDDTSFILAPIPDQVYTFEIHYSAQGPSVTLGGSSTTTWLSNNAYETLFYGSMVEAYTFMKGDQDLLNECKEQFALGIRRLQDLGEARNRKDTYRDGELRKAEA